MKYFVIGDEDTVLGFSLVGVKGSAVTDKQTATEVFNKVLEEKDYGIVIITDEIADLIREKVDKYLFSESFPLIVEIPSPHGNCQSKDLHQLVNDAIGVSL